VPDGGLPQPPFLRLDDPAHQRLRSLTMRPFGPPHSPGGSTRCAARSPGSPWSPYPLYAELRAAGVARQTDGSYLVGTYHEITALLHDPRISADPRNLARGGWRGR
jgi:cytochrome P450